jgi:predicted RNA-binding protein YlqC (UPF0109 family)
LIFSGVKCEVVFGRNDAGKILATQQQTTPALKEVLEAVKGRVCSAFKPSNAHYLPDTGK